MPKIVIDGNATKSIAETFELFYREQTLTDVTLVCEDGQQTQAHGVVLESSSVFLKSLINISKSSYSFYHVILLPNISVYYLNLVLELIYTGMCNIYSENFADLVSLFRYLQIEVKIQYEIEHFKNQNTEIDIVKTFTDELSTNDEEQIIRNDFSIKEIKSKEILAVKFHHVLKEKGQIDNELILKFNTEEEIIDNNVEPAKISMLASEYKLSETMQMGSQDEIVVPKKCLRCGYSTNSALRIERHLKCKPTSCKAFRKHKTLYKCDNCNFKTKRKYELKKHKGYMSAKGYCPNRQKKTWLCSICDKIFNKPCNLNLHMKQHDTGPVKCKICQTTMRDIISLRQHVKHCKPICSIGSCKVTGKRGCRMSQCKACKKVFEHTNMLKAHVKICEINCSTIDCNFTLSGSKRRTRMTDHVTKHLDQTKQKTAYEEEPDSSDITTSKYKCDIKNCNFSSESYNILKLHDLDHTETQRIFISCPECGFLSKRNKIQKHIGLHNKVNVICNRCEHDFKDSIFFKMHLPCYFTCHYQECDYQTKRKILIVNHTRIKHKENVDNKRTGTHEYISENVDTYPDKECDRCDFVSESKEGLKDHRLKKHNISKL